MARPGKAELHAALDVFGEWLGIEADEANSAVGQSYNAKTTTLPELAELVGLSKGLAAAESLIRSRIDELLE